MKKLTSLFFNKKSLNINNIQKLNIKEKISDIYIIGNGPSLNKFDLEKLKNKFTIGTNRSWLLLNTNILIWRDHRITEEINFFKVDKKNNSLWICSNDKSFIKNELNNYDYVKKHIDYTYNDNWIKKKLKMNIKWNGIIFHAITLAKHISWDATIHLIGVDLQLNNLENHHFFYKIPGFNQGFYKKNWDPKNFNFKSRLDMMYKNFETMKKNGFIFKNYSKDSKLKNLFGIEEIDQI